MSYQIFINYVIWMALNVVCYVFITKGTKG